MSVDPGRAAQVDQRIAAIRENTIGLAREVKKEGLSTEELGDLIYEVAIVEAVNQPAQTMALLLEALRALAWTVAYLTLEKDVPS